MASIIGVETLQHTNGTTAITIDSSGFVKQNSIYVSAGVTSLQTLTTDTNTLVNFDDQIHSSGLTWDTTNKKCVFDATTAGRYMITVNLAFFSSGNNMEACFIYPYKNNSQFRNTICFQNGQTSTALGSLRHFCGQGHYVHNFASGDEFSVYARLDVGSSAAHIHERQYGSELHLVRLGD